MRSFSLEVNGHRYSATWQVKGRYVEVRSDYGSSSMELFGRDPAVVARNVLASIVGYRRA